MNLCKTKAFEALNPTIQAHFLGSVEGVWGMGRYPPGVATVVGSPRCRKVRQTKGKITVPSSLPLEARLQGDGTILLDVGDE